MCDTPGSTLPSIVYPLNAAADSQQFICFLQYPNLDCWLFQNKY